MKIWMSLDKDHSPKNAFLLRQSAVKDNDVPFPDNVIGVDFSPLIVDVMRYFEFRGYKVPDATQAMLFLMSEVGELADEVVQKTSEEWVRNHPENKGKGIAPEAGDVIMMTCALCSAVGVDPLEAMFEKMTAKGFDKDS